MCPRYEGKPREPTVGSALVAEQDTVAGLTVDTELLTTRGFVQLRDVRAGDEVYHPGGQPVRVAAVAETGQAGGCYRVATTDGRAITAGAGLLWTVQDKRRHRSLGPRGHTTRWFETVTITTTEMAAAGVSRYAAGGRTSLTGGKRYATNEYRFRLPAQGPVGTPDASLPVDPYVLGVWAGDGHTGSAALTCADPQIIDEIRKAGEPCIQAAGRYLWRISDGVRRGRGGGGGTLQARLRRLGVLGDKHIPDAYLTAGPRQREALLQGLLDTDGSIDGMRGQVEFCSMLPQLADAVLFLARSLGWRATLRTGRATLNGRDCGTKYRVYFTPKTSDPYCPFRLARKVARINDLDGGKGRFTVSVAAIETAGSQPVRCIEVNSPGGLFLAGRGLLPVRCLACSEGVAG
jgi:LAGLIDADG-like domain